MKQITYLLILMLLTVFNVDIKAQNEKTIDDFVIRVDHYLTEISKNTSDIYITKRIYNRKIKINGKFDNSTKIFKQKIKYFKGGIKKEIIKAKYLGPKKSYCLFKIVLINNEYFYIKVVSYSQGNSMIKIAEELLIDGKIYQKTEYDNNVKKNSETVIWKIK